MTGLCEPVTSAGNDVNVSPPIIVSQLVRARSRKVTDPKANSHVMLLLEYLVIGFQASLYGIIINGILGI